MTSITRFTGRKLEMWTRMGEAQGASQDRQQNVPLEGGDEVGDHLDGTVHLEGAVGLVLQILAVTAAGPDGQFHHGQVAGVGAHHRVRAVEGGDHLQLAVQGHAGQERGGGVGDGVVGVHDLQPVVARHVRHLGFIPLVPGVSTTSAPSAFKRLRRSILIVSGIVKTNLYPFTLDTKASPTPVLPLVGSMMVASGFNAPIFF